MLDQTLPVAENAAASFLETIAGDSIPLEVEDPDTIRQEDLEEHFGDRFAILGRSGGSEPFVALFDQGWLPFFSEAMLGERMEEWTDEADELIGEVAQQLYASIRNELSAKDLSLKDADFTVVGDAAGLPSDLLGNKFEGVPFEIETDDGSLSALVLVPSAALNPPDDPTAGEEETGSGAAAGTGRPKPGGSEPPAGGAASGSGAGGASGGKDEWPDAGDSSEAAPAGPTPADEIDRGREEEQDEKISVSSPSFPAFDEEGGGTGGGGHGDLSSMELLGDVEIELSVELGRRSMPLEDILRLTNGSIVELDKLAGEPLQIYANNRLVAEGEAVVIDDQFGIRITRLASTEKRARALM